MKTTFLICPVRGVDAEQWQSVVEKLEAEGWQVHWPVRDTNQQCETGLSICRDNLSAITRADCVHVVWDGKSQGCLFDLGMSFALGKFVVPILLPELSEQKSFQNMVTAWAQSE